MTCRLLESVYFPMVNRVGARAFESCYSLSSVSFPNVSSLPYGIFTSCYGLSNLSFSGINYVGESAFRFCYSLESISFYDYVSFGANVFYSCTILDRIVLNNSSICNISTSTFSGVLGSIKVYVPGSLVASYKENTNWASLSSRIFSIETMPSIIERNVITDITSIVSESKNTYHYISDSILTSISSSQFANYFALIGVDFPNVTNIGNGAFSTCSAISSFSLPNVESIGTLAFYSCVCLREINLPNVRYIGSSAFANCVQLSYISVPELTSFEVNTFSAVPIREIVLPKVENVPVYALDQHGTLTCIDLPVASVFGAGISGCSRLEKLILRSSSVVSIDLRAFYQPPNSTYKIHVPSSLYNDYVSRYSTYTSRFVSITE